MRVEFKITSYMLQSGKVVQALRDVFGERAAKYAHCAQDLTIECDAGRFTRFLIARDKYGASNDWKGLRCREVAPPAPVQPREVF